MKGLLKQALVGVGVDRLLRPVYGGRGAVLMFHRLRPRDAGLGFPETYRSDVAPEAFARLLDAFKAGGIAVVSLDEAAARLAGRDGGRFVVLTFDDGYRDNFEALLPIAEARGVPVTVYVTTGFVDRTAPMWWYALDAVIAREARVSLPLDGERSFETGTPVGKAAAFVAAHGFLLRAAAEGRARVVDALAERYGVDFTALAAAHAMDWEMVRRMAASPCVEIGGHTVSHPALAALDEDTARREMADGRDRLAAEIGRPVRHFAFPYGGPETTGAREVRLARELGFATAVTSNAGSLFAAHAARRHAWPRYGIGPDDGPDALRLKLAGLPVARTRPFRPAVYDPGGTI